MDHDDMTMNTARVRELLDERRWTWADLARQMRMSKSTINRVERGKTRPGRKFVFALQRVFPGETDLFVQVQVEESDAA